MNKDLLQNYYNSFINQKDQRTFLSGLADYVGFILEDEGSKGIISDILKTKQTLLDEKEKWEKIVENQTKAIKKVIPRLNSKTDVSTRELSDEIADRIMYSKANPKLLEIEEIIKEGQESSVWGAWEKMQSARQEYPNSASNKPIENYKPYLNRVHNHLLKKLAEKTISVDHNSSIDSQTDNIDDKSSEQGGPQEVESIMMVVDKPGGHCKTIWLVFNNDFSNIVKFPTAGKRGSESYIMTLYRVRDRAQIGYDRQIATSINSKIFERREINGKYKQATIIEKGSDDYFRINDKIKVSTKSKEFLTQEQLKNFPFDLKYHPREFGKRPEKYKTSRNF